jgi:hypothetical protein
MKVWTAPDIPLTIVLFAALAAVVLRATARRPEHRRVTGTEPAPVTVTVTANETQPRPGVAAGQHIFHELHPQGRNALCAVCDSQYKSA